MGDNFKRVYGIAEYKAVRAPRSNLIELTATGLLPCANYTAALEQRPERVVPPMWDMIFYTQDICLTAFRPFVKKAHMVEGITPAKELIVHDARGEIKVPVVDEISAAPEDFGANYTEKFSVYARLPSPLKGHKGCIVVPAGSIVLAIYYRAYGPKSRQECDDWVRDNCSEFSHRGGEIPWPLAH